MRAERRETVARQELKGYTVSPNEAAGLLEKTLGITFPEKPKMVVLSGRNKLRYLMVNGLIPTIAAGLLKGGAAGVYRYQFHAYFVEDGEDLFAGLHENMHGFAAVVNPEIPRQQEIMVGAVSERAADKMVEVDVERAIALRCFDEGMAQWGAVRAATFLDESFDKGNLDEMDGLMLRNGKEGQVGEADEDFISGEFEKLRQAREVYARALGRSGPRAAIEAVKAEMGIADSLYFGGYYFVDKSMRELLGLGIGMGEAITLLVKNPPGTYRN